MPALDELLEAADKFLGRARHVAKLRQVLPLEADLEQHLATIFTRQGKRVAAAWLKAAKAHGLPTTGGLREAAGGPDAWLDGLLDSAIAEDTADMAAAIVDAATQAMQAGAKAAVNELGGGIRFDLKSTRAVAYLKSIGADRLAGIEDTTKAGIRALILAGIERGDSPGEIAKNIIAEYGEYAEPVERPHYIHSRAHMIATTEIGDAYEQAGKAIAGDLQDAGIEIEKYWSAYGSGVCDLCLSNEEAGWIPNDDEFPSGDSEPLGHPGCRCCALYRRVRSDGTEE